jgi:hypothetical protein
VISALPRRRSGVLDSDGQLVPKKDMFRHLGSMLQKDRDINEDVNKKIKVNGLN